MARNLSLNQKFLKTLIQYRPHSLSYSGTYKYTYKSLKDF